MRFQTARPGHPKKETAIIRDETSADSEMRSSPTGAVRCGVVRDGLRSV